MHSAASFLQKLSATNMRHKRNLVHEQKLIKEIQEMCQLMETRDDSQVPETLPARDFESLDRQLFKGNITKLFVTKTKSYPRLECQGGYHTRIHSLPERDQVLTTSMSFNATRLSSVQISSKPVAFHIHPLERPEKLSKGHFLVDSSQSLFDVTNKALHQSGTAKKAALKGLGVTME